MSAVIALSASSLAAQSPDGQVTVEIFVDSDPGFGNGTIYAAELGENAFSVSTKELTPGAHILSTRVKDAYGNWSATVTNPLYISDDRLFVAAEYFIDSDPGQGLATAITEAATGARMFSFNVKSGSIEPGAHTLSVRVMGADGTWTDVMTRPFIVTKGVPVLTGDVIEYFFDADPGYGLGNHVAATDGENVFFVPTNGLTPGAHIISVRCHDVDGNWSATITNPLYVAEPCDVDHTEYFVDTDPGEGLGTPVALDADGCASFTVPTAGLTLGKHRLVFRGCNSVGKYVTVFEAPFSVDETGGIARVEWTMPVNVCHSNGHITVSGKGLTQGSLLEVYNLSGIRVYCETISQNDATVTIDVAGQACPFIVRVTQPDGTRTIRRIL